MSVSYNCSGAVTHTVFNSSGREIGFITERWRLGEVNVTADIWLKGEYVSIGTQDDIWLAEDAVKQVYYELKRRGEL